MIERAMSVCRASLQSRVGGRLWAVALLAAVAVLLLTAGPASAAASRAIQNGHDPFPSSVASGDPRPDSVILWTRVDSLTDEEPKLLTVEVAADEAFTTIVSQRQIAASGENDYCTKVRISGLDPHTTYYYRFLYQESSSPIGKTRTAPGPGVEQPLRFAVAYCQDYIGRYYNASARCTDWIPSLPAKSAIVRASLSTR